MKRFETIVIAGAVAAWMLAGCSQETKEQAREAAQSTTQDAQVAVQSVQQKSAEVVKEAQSKASDAMEKAKQAASDTLEKAKKEAAKVQEQAKSVATEAAAAVEEKASQVRKELGGGAKQADAGKALFAKCAGCHGADGKTKALGKSPAIAGMDADKVTQMLHAYKSGSRNAYGMGGVMQGQAASLSESDIAALAAYISSLK